MRVTVITSIALAACAKDAPRAVTTSMTLSSGDVRVTMRLPRGYRQMLDQPAWKSWFGSWPDPVFELKASPPPQDRSCGRGRLVRVEDRADGFVVECDGLDDAGGVGEVWVRRVVAIDDDGVECRARFLPSELDGKGVDPGRATRDAAAAVCNTLQISR